MIDKVLPIDIQKALVSQIAFNSQISDHNEILITILQHALVAENQIITTHLKSKDDQQTVINMESACKESKLKILKFLKSTKPYAN